MNTLLDVPDDYSSVLCDFSLSGFDNSSFENYLLNLIESLDKHVRDLAKFVLFNGGKRIRPLLVHACSIPEPSFRKDLFKASAILEIIHVATLVHDDILDKAQLRRGKQTIHSLYDEHTAILLGDALFSFALELASQFPDSTVCRIVAAATKKTCSGEINQNFAKGNLFLSSDDYLQIIQDKTGELFRASCFLGGHISECSLESCISLGNFGASLGINYQLYDDLLDVFGDHAECGKTLGSDLKSKKFTLPFLKLLEEVPSGEKAELKGFIENHNPNEEFFNFVGELLLKHNIHEICWKELDKRISISKLIAVNFPHRIISNRLTTFLAAFETKVKKLSFNQLPNFVALS